MQHPGCCAEASVADVPAQRVGRRHAAARPGLTPLLCLAARGSPIRRLPRGLATAGAGLTPPEDRASLAEPSDLARSLARGRFLARASLAPWLGRARAAAGAGVRGGGDPALARAGAFPAGAALVPAARHRPRTDRWPRWLAAARPPLCRPAADARVERTAPQRGGHGPRALPGPTHSQRCRPRAGWRAQRLQYNWRSGCRSGG
mmetsp:Transcript_106682/g.334630  ORF Transcript_106682/g.334630 Transcript_106682/m.334630 type:complete len:204 (+) Transcript_106682:1021-1632(+)